MPKYEIIEQYFAGELAGEIIQRTNDDGSITSFLKDELNPDYQEYLASLKDAAK